MHHHLKLIVLLSGLFLLGTSAGQPPQPALEPLPEEAQQEDQIVVPLSEPAKRFIEDALRRQAADPTAPVPSTGDAVLDDILEVIRRQGSVLDGSVLDPQLDRDPIDLPRLPRERMDPEPPPRPPTINGQIPALPVPDAVGPDARFHVAESLLRAARKLAALPERDQASERLIAAMREQATVLLLDEYSEDTNR